MGFIGISILMGSLILGIFILKGAEMIGNEIAMSLKYLADQLNKIEQWATDKKK